MRAPSSEHANTCGWGGTICAQIVMESSGSCIRVISSRAYSTSGATDSRRPPVRTCVGLTCLTSTVQCLLPLAQHERTFCAFQLFLRRL